MGGLPRLTGVDMDKLRAEQEERLRAIEDGILQPGEAMTVKEARKRWYERCRHQTILSRRTRAIEGKQRRKLAELPFDERKRQVAERIFRDMKGDIHHLTPQQFEKMVWTAYSHAWRSLNNIHADHSITSMPIAQ